MNNKERKKKKGRTRTKNKKQQPLVARLSHPPVRGLPPLTPGKPSRQEARTLRLPSLPSWLDHLNHLFKNQFLISLIFFYLFPTSNFSDTCSKFIYLFFPLALGFISSCFRLMLIFILQFPQVEAQTIHLKLSFFLILISAINFPLNT